MFNPNNTLPENFQNLIRQMSTRQAMPLGMLSEIPFLAVKIAPEDAAYFRQNAIVCELKPSVFNIDYNDATLAICVVQLRLNERDDLIYTAIYDLNEAKQYHDCRALLEMHRYGLFVASDDLHDFQAFEAHFEADFDPRNLLDEAREKRTDYEPGDFYTVAHNFCWQYENDVALWNRMHELAPIEQQWYARVRMDVM